jgi:HK97 family phage portal protein
VAFVIAAGTLAQTDRPTDRAPYALSLPSGDTADYATIWKTQPQVRTVVAFLARNIAQLTIQHFRRVSDNDRQRLQSPVAQLLGRPGPDMTRYRAFDSLMNDLGIFDAAYWAKVKTTDGTPGALVRLDPRKTKPVGDNPFTPDAFELKGSKGKRTLPADQVVYFRGYNPTNALTGCSPIETLRQILLEEWNANAYREQLWRNGARVSGYLSRPIEAPPWSKPARDRFRSEWQAQYVGDGPQAGGTPILEDGMTFSGAAVTPADAQYLESRKLTREEVAAAYHVPQPMVGILDHATFSNIREQHKQLYQDCLGPWLQMIVEELALQLLPDFPDTLDTYVEFNLAAKLSGSFEEEAASLSTSVGAPWMTRNEARGRKNLPAVEGGDELITPLNVLVGGQASPTDSAPDPADALKAAPRSPLTRRIIRRKAKPQAAHVARAQTILAAYFERQGRAITSALGDEVKAVRAARATGRKADVDLDTFWDDERWDGELSADLFGLNTLIATACAHSTLEALGEDPDDYDEDRTLHWLTANADRVAGAVNGATKRRLIDVLADAVDPVEVVAGLFATYASARAPQLAKSHATSLAGFGTTEAARQSGRESTKTWRVRSSNPRKSHARMDGETVGLHDAFSNGAQWPGDSSLDVDETAGCTCEVEIEFAD